MSTYTPPVPTWRICHPVNIYVYQNGCPNEKPCLVHIPMEKKKNMTTVLEAIGERMKLAVGYPVGLYHMDGSRVCKTYELEMYNNYVVVTNLEKRFKCVEYGKVREPLVVIGRYSKHINTLKWENRKFDLFCRRKMARKPLHELMANSDDQDGLGPSEISVSGKPCGALCHKVMPRRDRPTQCCSDEIMCVEGAAMDVERDDCRALQRELEKQCYEEQRRSLEVPPGTTMTDEDCKMIEELQKQVRDNGEERLDGAAGGGGGGGGGTGPLGVNKNLVDLMLRYKDVGSDIFRLFQNKINRDLDGGAENAISQRWEIPTGGSNLSIETQQKVKEELIKLAEQSCQFTFDRHGNFLFSEGCRVNGAGSRLSDVGVSTDKEAQPQQGPSKRTSGGGGEAGGGQAQQQRRPSQEGKGEGSQGAMNIIANMLQVEVDEENNLSTGSIPGLTKNDSKKKMMMEEATGTSQFVLEDEEEEMEMDEWIQMAEAAAQGQESRRSSKQRVNKMQSEITEIVGNMRRSLTMSRNNSLNGSLVPPRRDMPSPPRTLSRVQEEQEDDGGEEEMDPAEVKVTVSSGSNKSKKKRDDDDYGEDEGGNGGGGEMNVFSLMMESRNPFREGIKQVPSLAGKLHNDRLDKLFAENPFRRYWFHGEDTPRDKNDHMIDVDEDEFLRNILPPPPPPQDDTPIFSPRGSRTEWWPPKRPDVFLQQINELVHRHDNTKATSPPPPLPPIMGRDSIGSFTIGPSPRSSQASMVSVACGQSITDMKKKPPPLRHRNVCAQVGVPQMDEVEIEEHKSIEFVRPPMWNVPRCYEGGTQTRLWEEETSFVVLPSEDEKPAGIYEGYQESIKSDAVVDILSSDNDGDDERKVYYRKRKENRRVRRKRKEKCLHPCFSPEEEEYAEEEDEITADKATYVPNSVQQIRFFINNNGSSSPQQYTQQPSSSRFPQVPQTQQQQQQPFFMQASSTTPTTLPVLARNSTQTTSPNVIKTLQGGFVTGGPQSQIQLPLILSQQQTGGGGINRGGFINNANMITTSPTPLLRQPIIFTTQPTPQIVHQQQQQSVKFLPVLQPQNTSMRIIRLVHPTQQFVTASPSTAYTNPASGGGALQNKLVQMMAPAFQPITFPSQQQMIQRPQPQQQQQQQQPPPPHQSHQQFMFK